MALAESRILTEKRRRGFSPLGIGFWFSSQKFPGREPQVLQEVAGQL